MAKRRLTRLEMALASRLERAGWPVVTPYRLFLELRVLHLSGRKLHLRKPVPDHEDLRRRRRNLMEAAVLAPDPDYRRRAYRVLANGDGAAEEIACLADRFCHVSHLSAMARYGLTDRRPEALHLSTPHERVMPELLRQAMIRDYGEEVLEALDDRQIVPLRGVRHPEVVRGRPLVVFSTVEPGPAIDIRGTHARIATIGQTFADMLEEPRACGGMAHVLEVWRDHAAVYFDDIVTAVQYRSRAITKVRAGYILEERLGLADGRVRDWVRFAQRGSSRVLDPHAPFADTYSKKWMLSINVNG